MEQKIHDILGKYLHGYIPTQELTHAANEICKNPTEDTVFDMTTYLMQFDKEFIPLQTVNTKALTNNQVRFAMAEIRQLIDENKTEEEGN